MTDRIARLRTRKIECETKLAVAKQGLVISAQGRKAIEDRLVAQKVAGMSPEQARRYSLEQITAMVQGDVTRETLTLARSTVRDAQDALKAVQQELRETVEAARSLPPPTFGVPEVDRAVFSASDGAMFAQLQRLNANLERQRGEHIASGIPQVETLLAEIQRAERGGETELARAMEAQLTRRLALGPQAIAKPGEDPLVAVQRHATIKRDLAEHQSARVDSSTRQAIEEVEADVARLAREMSSANVLLMSVEHVGAVAVSD